MITQKNKAKTVLLIRTIKASWRRSVENLLTVGQCLHELKILLDRPTFLEQLEEHLSMSEVQAFRLQSLYLKFHDKKSIQVLSSKPSVLYLLASTMDSKRIESLAKGGKVKVGCNYKTLSQLTIKDVIELSEAAKQPQKALKEKDDQEDDDRDKERARTAHRRLGTLVEEINDWSQDLIRFNQNKVQINNKELVQKYVKETIECLKELDQLLS